MNSTTDTRLDLMARSLQEHIDLAKELNLNFVAQLLTMTAMEIRINLLRISEQEMDTLCDCADAQLPAPMMENKPGDERGAGETARVINFPGRGRCS